MKKSILTLLLVLHCALNLTAQNYNPFVSSPSISPSPIPDVQSNGSALFSFTVGNTGSLAMPIQGNQSLKISISLLRGIPNTTGVPSNAVSGSWAQYFSWSYNSQLNVLTGTQTQTLPANDSGTIIVDYLVTSNSTVTSPQNGFNINLAPPPYSAGANLQGDDNINAFTYTVAAVPSGPNYNPFVSSPSINPTPIPDVQSNGSALFSFTVGNDGNLPMPVQGSQSLKISISLLRGIPNTTSAPSNAVSGSWAQYFSWSYDSQLNVLTGTQTQTLPSNDSGTITVDYLVTSNSTVSNPQNGFNINLIPPPYSASANLQGDDNVSAFTYTFATVTGPNYNPFVSSPSINPTPIPDVQSNGSALFSFTVGNDGNLPMPVQGSQSLKISISLLRGIPNTTSAPSNAISGSWSQYFSWSYDSQLNVLTGTQTQTLPSNDSGTITVDYLVTSNSTASNPQNGFNINLAPPPYSAGANLQGDDNINAFTYTVAAVPSGPNYNPFVSSPSINPTPIPDVQSNGSALFSFTVGNNGNMPMSVQGSQSLKISISLLRGIPNTSGALSNAISGSWSQYFSWSYDSQLNVLTGTQTQTLPALDSGSIVIDYLVTSNSSITSPQNGFNINLIPPPYSAGANLQGDDNASAFTYTVPTITGVPNITLGALVNTPSIAVGGNTSINFYINNSGSAPTTGTLIDVIIIKPSDGTLTLNVPAGWSVAANSPSFIRLNSSNIIQPGLANSEILIGTYTHSGVNQTAVKSTNIIAAPGSGGETSTSDNEAGGFIQVN